MSARVAIFAVCGILVSGPLAAQESNLVEDALQPGDLIRLAISREPDMSGEYPVDVTGNVGLPLIGVVDVKGKSPATLRSEILGGFQDQLRNQTIQVTLLRRVRVLGQVNDPGLYHADPTMTLSDVIALAGGPTSQGRMNDVRIVRGATEFEADVGREVLGQVRSGDQIVVPERGWAARNSAYLIGAAISVTAIIIGQL